mgnify:CR=1 FL=1
MAESWFSTVLMYVSENFLPFSSLALRRPFCQSMTSFDVMSTTLISPKNGMSFSLIMYSLLRHVVSLNLGRTSSA